MIESYEQFRKLELQRVVLWQEIPEHLRYYYDTKYLDDIGQHASCQAAARVCPSFLYGHKTHTKLIKKCLVITKAGETFCWKHNPAYRIVRNVVDPDEVSAQWESVMSRMTVTA